MQEADEQSGGKNRSWMERREEGDRSLVYSLDFELLCVIIDYILLKII